jgi:hypothetical protein
MACVKYRKAAFAAVLLAAAAAPPLRAHHSFTAFDNTTTVTMICTVKEFQWVNPHTSLTVVTENAAGELQEYRFEGVPPAILIRSGWTEDTLLAGDRISLDFHPMKDGTPGGTYVAITLPTGKRLGTSGTSFVPFKPANARPPTPPPPAPPPHPIIIE